MNFIQLLCITLICTLYISSVSAMENKEREEAQAELNAIAKQMNPISRAFNLIHKVAGPSVVSVQIQRKYVRQIGLANARREVKLGEGSGFIFSSDDEYTYIITNAHVVLQQNQRQEFIKRGSIPVAHENIRIETHDRRTYDAEYVGGNTKTDIAVVRIKQAHMPSISWANSDTVDVGEWVLALGYPLGVGYSASSGIISATARDTGVYDRERGFESFIQTDAAINQGNSGGPLLNLRGEVIGVNASILSRSNGNIGLGFAIPGNLARRVAEDLKEFGHFSFPMVGIDMRELTQDEADTHGINNPKAVMINIVFPGTPAAEAGLQSGDIILSVNNKAISGLEDIRTRLASARIGHELPISVSRAGEAMQMTVSPVSGDEILRRIEDHVSNRKHLELRDFGITVSKLPNEQGIFISAVDAQHASGLGVGDHIYDIVGYGRISNVVEFERIASRQQIIFLRVIQNGKIKKIRLMKKQK
ncbi:MAG: trypsin-like peptidase domain-containing protein [Planctomycetes bacterium]|nr:trypsin-like peptidase domain-containing protein [Planctomycetota bacterium]